MSTLSVEVNMFQPHLDSACECLSGIEIKHTLVTLVCDLWGLNGASYEKDVNGENLEESFLRSLV